jgi:hypothetical protein
VLRDSFDDLAAETLVGLERIVLGIVNPYS